MYIYQYINNMSVIFSIFVIYKKNTHNFDKNLKIFNEMKIFIINLTIILIILNIDIIGYNFY
jgi:hypothetical protein